jgi:hypothetical protein
VDGDKPAKFGVLLGVEFVPRSLLEHEKNDKDCAIFPTQSPYHNFCVLVSFFRSAPK